MRIEEATKVGVVILSEEEAWPATVTLTVTRHPSRAVGQQSVEVEFHGEVPPDYRLVAAGELTFKDEDGQEHVLQFSGSRWMLREPKAFLAGA